MKKILVGVAMAIVFLLIGYFSVVAYGCEERCKHENAECQINESGMSCCEGLICVPFNPTSGNGKCLPIPTATPTPTDTPEPTPTEVPTPTDTPKNEPGPKGPPEWENPCFYLRDSEECKPKSEVFPDEGQVFGPNK